MALNLLRRGGMIHWHIRNTPDGGITFRLPGSAAKIYLAACEAEGVPVSVSPVRGMPALLHRYRRRWGMLIGAVAFALMTALSCRVVWEVEVSGNEKLDDGRIIQMLREYGFGEGTPYRNVDFDVLQNEFLMTTDDIAWISVNMTGTVAHVQVRENLGSKENRPGTVGASNVVAGEDGQITEVRVRGGSAAVGVNDVVRRGELLISGIIAVGEDSIRYEHAEGEVLAKVRRQICVEIPLYREVKIYTGEESVKKSLIFFGKKVKLFTKSSIDTPTYDTILSEESIPLPMGGTLPVRIRTEKERAYRTESVPMDKGEAYIEAVRQYQLALSALLQETEILSAEVEHSFDGRVYRITADLTCVTDIARVTEIITS
jgi:similar to stage IV sporulation protein